MQYLNIFSKSFSERLDVLNHIGDGAQDEFVRKSNSDSAFQNWFDTEIDRALAHRWQSNPRRMPLLWSVLSRRLPSQEICDKYEILLFSTRHSYNQNRILPAVKRNIDNTTMALAFLAGTYAPESTGGLPQDDAEL